MVASAGLLALVCAAVAVSALPLGVHPAQGVVVRREIIENTLVARSASGSGQEGSRAPDRSATINTVSSVASTGSGRSGGDSTDPTSPSSGSENGAGVNIHFAVQPPSPPQTSPIRSSPRGSPPSSGLSTPPAESSAGPSTPRGAQTSLYAPAPSTPGAGPSTLHAADPFPDRLTATATAPDWNRIHHNIMPHGASNHEPPPWAAAANARYQREEDQRAERQRLAHQAEMERLERMGRGTPMPQRPGRDLVREATEAVRLRSQTPDGRRQLSQILIPKPADLKGKRRK